MAASFESSNSFVAAFDKLVQELDDMDTGGGLTVGFRKLLRPTSEDTDVFTDLLSLTNGLKFWKYLKKLLFLVHKCSSNADEVVHNWESRLIKIQAAFDEITDKIMFLSQKKTMSERPAEAFDVLSALEENACKLLKVEIGETLDYLSSSPLEWKWNYQPFPTNVSLCCELLECIHEILVCIMHNPCFSADHEPEERTFLERVTSLRLLLGFVRPGEPYFQSVIPFPDNNLIENFLSHLASVAVRTANQSVFYWINKKVETNIKIDGLLQLQNEIDPVSPEFLEWILRLLRALPKTGRDLSVGYFSSYIIRPYVSHYAGLQNGLGTLMLFVINESEENPSCSLVARIEVMLKLVVLYRRELCHLSSLEFYARICVLEAEVFLKQELNGSSTISLGNEIEKLGKFLSSITDFSDEPEENKTGYVEQSFMFLHELAGELDSLDQNLNEKKISEQVQRILLSKLLLKVVFFEAEFSCVKFSKFLDSNEIMMGTAKDGIETFIEELNLFKSFVTTQQEETTSEDVELIFAHIEASARGIITLGYSLEMEETAEEMFEKLILSFSDLLDKMAVVKAEVRLLCTAPPSSDFPRTDGIGFIYFLLENLRELLKCGPGSIVPVKHHLERIQLDLEAARTFLMKLDAGDSEFVDLVKRLTDVGYEAEYIIDSIEIGNGDHWQHLLWLYDVINKIRLINEQATDVCREKSCDPKRHNLTQISTKKISEVTKAEISEVLVCISDEEERVIVRLTRGSQQRDVVSIVGMPGIGKTTLAKKVYNAPKVRSHFHVRAWCTVSQVYSKRELLMDILTDIASGFAERRDILQMTDNDLELQLYRCLKQKRYLIVLDDVWDVQAWNCLDRSFPNDSNGSRVLITSRLRDVILKAKPNSDPHELRLFSEEESWKLLQMKIFQGGCPEELLEVGKEIAKNCKGLPLSIVAIAGLLEKTERKQDTWRRIAESLTAQIIDDPKARCMDILHLSYNHLPDHLKACFLYYGAFLVAKDIPVCKLIRLWIAEGFIQKTALKSLEDLAQDYVADLIGRSLVTASRKGSDGRVKACRMHDLLHEMCLSKAKEESFLQLITGSDEPYASFSDIDFSDDFIDYYTFNPVKYENYRVSVFLNRKQFVKSSPSGPGTRSLIFSATSDQYPRCPYDISFIPTSFKLLRVLVLETINMGTSFPTGIELLAQLRYLAVSGDIDFIPPTVSKLQKLETLIVKGLKGKVTLPDTIWCMEKLRHLHVNNHVVFNFDDDNLGNFLQLVNLLSFSSPSLAYGKENTLRRMPNLCKLKCIFFESWYASSNYNKFPVMDFLDQLESLKILYIGRCLNPGELILPMNLKKLTLSNFRLPWTHIAAIGGLKHLEVLKLLSRAFEGKTWDMNEGEFLKLKYLKLDRLNIAQWNASGDHLPNLEQLVVRNCELLEEVPYTFGEIPTLLRIEVQSCGQSTEESVRNIGELEVEGLEIIINQKIHI